MKKSIILYASILSNIAAVQQPVSPCSLAPAGDKQALIAALVCLENHNKELILRLEQYDSLLRIIRGEDGSDCLANRCINDYELSIKVVTAPARAQLKVEFGDGTPTIVTGGEFTSVKFTGTIGTLADDLLVDQCHRTGNSMSYVRVSNNSTKTATIESVELKLRYPNDTYKTVFFADKLSATNSLTISKDSILSNQAFSTAAAGSCHDD